MSDATEALEADLSGRALDGVNGAEELVDFFRVVVAFERNQAIAYDLQVLFGFGLEEFENLVGNLVVCWEGVEIGSCGSSDRFVFEGRKVRGWLRRGLREIEGRRLGREGEAVALLEGRDVFDIFGAGVADFEQIGFEQRNPVGEELGQRAVQVVAKRRVQCVLENVCELAGNFGKARKSVACRRAAESVRGNIEALEIFMARLNVLQDADILAEILEMLGSLLEEHLDGFAVQRAHARPSVTSSAFCDSSAVGLRYRM